MHENAEEPIADLPQQLGLDAIAAPQDSSPDPDESTQLETVSSENDRLEIENDGLKQNIAERKKYAHRIFCMISCWLGGVFAILILEGFGILSFRLSDSVILAVVGSVPNSVEKLIAHFV